MIMALIVIFILIVIGGFFWAAIDASPIAKTAFKIIGIYFLILILILLIM